MKIRNFMLVILSGLILLGGCGINNKIVNNGSNSTGNVEKTSTVNNNSDSNNNGISSNQLIEFVLTTCPHCREAVPHLQEFNNKHDGVNITLNVLDRKPFPGVVKLKQNYVNPKDISEYTNENCGYVPSYVILSKAGQLLDYKCGGTPTEETLEKYLLSNKPSNNSSVTTGTNISTGTNVKQGSGVNLNNNNKNMNNEKPSEVRIGDTVSVDYVGTFDDGKVFDTSIEDSAKKAGLYDKNRPYTPLTFKVGEKKMIECFENGVVGMKLGETKDIKCSPKQAYGECSKDLIKHVKKSDLQEIEKQGGKIEKGLQISNGYNRGVITSVDGDDVTLDFNSPMCGKNLNFKVTIKDIQG